MEFTHPIHNIPKMIFNQGFNTFGSFTSMFHRAGPGQHCHTCFNCDEPQDDSKRYNAAFTNFQTNDPIFFFNGKTTVEGRINQVFKTNRKIEYQLKLHNGKTTTATSEFMVHADDPNVSVIPDKVSKIRETTKNISQQQINEILHPKLLSPLELEFLDIHERLLHIPMHMIYFFSKNEHITKTTSKSKETSIVCLMHIW